MSDTSFMLWSLLFNSIGLGYFVYGKKQGHTSALLCGIALMVYSFFLANLYAMIAIGIGLMLLPRYIKR